MTNIAFAAILIAATGFVGQAAAEQPRHSKPHKRVCHIEHHKVKMRGKWVLKETRVCK